MENKIIKAFCLSVALAGLLSACSTTQEITKSSRSATEQLLITEAVMRSLPKQRDLPFPIPRGSAVKLEVTGLTADKDIVKGTVAGWLGLHGYIVRDENVSHRINIMVDSLGTELASTFFGIPPIRATLIPIALPELALYKSENQSGYARFHFDIFESPSGQFLASSSPFITRTFYNAYTVLLLFTFNKTDLVTPPEAGKLQDLIK